MGEVYHSTSTIIRFATSVSRARNIVSSSCWTRPAGGGNEPNRKMRGDRQGREPGFLTWFRTILIPVRVDAAPIRSAEFGTPSGTSAGTLYASRYHGGHRWGSHGAAGRWPADHAGGRQRAGRERRFRRQCPLRRRQAFANYATLPLHLLPDASGPRRTAHGRSRRSP